MILYSVTVNIDRQVEQDWLQWMKSVHIPEVMDTGLPMSYKLLRLLTEIETSFPLPEQVRRFSDVVGGGVS
jgi:hypothetical protein